MKRSYAVLCLAMGMSALFARADVLLGALGTESGVPIGGEEDIVIFNLTGPGDGCSTPSGTPVCTSVVFDNVVLNINGTTHLSVGDVNPGTTETYLLSSGTFTDGSITSLSLEATLSSTTLLDDLGNTYTVESAIVVDGVPTDGILANISGTSLVTTPEPNMALPILLLLSLSGVVVIGRRVKMHSKGFVEFLEGLSQ